ncbi:hypothetical protein [Amycolatopsis nigrescens]|uniref:hypothetical protein n=1 Tax=Amycolatopsis nigrescens TaxID=381445 RepID=UPI00037AB54D|nr:hypothetical protein [Amycolatopsis nigrescens]
MTFAVGLFDLFTYTIPGALHLSVFAYLAGRLHWIDLGAVGRGPVVLLVIGIVLVSYLLGYLAYPLGAWAERLLPRRRQRDLRQEFLRRNPAARDRAFVKADTFLLYSALLLHDKDVALEVTRMRSSGLMLRNSSPPMVFGFVASAVELFTGRNPVFAAGCLVLFAVAVPGLITQGRKHAHWANLKTLELCFWVPDIDDKVTAPEGG